MDCLRNRCTCCGHGCGRRRHDGSGCVSSWAWSFSRWLAGGDCRAIISSHPRYCELFKTDLRGDADKGITVGPARRAVRVQGRARKAEPCAGILWRPVPFAVGSCVAGIDPSRVWISCHGRAWVRSKATSADSGAQAGGADAGGGGGQGARGGGAGDQGVSIGVVAKNGPVLPARERSHQPPTWRPPAGWTPSLNKSIARAAATRRAITSSQTRAAASHQLLVRGNKPGYHPTSLPTHPHGPTSTPSAFREYVVRPKSFCVYQAAESYVADEMMP